MSTELDAGPDQQSPAATPDPAPAAARSDRRGRGGGLGGTLLVTVLSFLVAMLIGGVLIAAADPATRTAAGYFASYPWDTFTFGAQAAWHGYVALFEGAIYNPKIADNHTAAGYFGPISETLTNATPLIAGGLSVAVAFRAGLFNIGGQGQIVLGAIFAGYVGFHFDLPTPLHVIAAVAAGILGGALWGGIVGFLKARTGAHEVITTIMLNYVAVALLGYLLSVRGFQAPPYGQAISNPVDANARLFHLFGPTMRVNAALLLSLLAAVAVWWLLSRSTLGFRLKAVGANQFAARTAGMSVERSYLVVMLIAGGLAGLAGVSQILGTNSQLTGDIDAGIGFDAITVALLGRATPLGTVLAGLLFGALHAGGTQLSAVTGTPIEIVEVIQSLIVLFIAAPALIRALFRLKRAGSGVGAAQLAKGWNG